MKEIQLTQNKTTLVDDIDYKELSKYNWYTIKSRNTFYAVRMSKNPRTTIHMHSVIIGKPNKGFILDHINGDGLDNRRHNLRFVTLRQNCQNKVNIKKTSKYPGVSWYAASKKWQVHFQFKGKQHYLGRYSDERQAFEVYKNAVEAIGETIVGY